MKIVVTVLKKPSRNDMAAAPLYRQKSVVSVNKMTTQPVLEIGTNKSQVISLLSILIFLLSNIN